MQIQINTDNSIDGDTTLIDFVERTAEQKLRAVASHITRVEIHLKDENAHKGGADDKRCNAEARIEGRAPIAVSHNDATVQKAAIGALDKLRAALDSDLGKRGRHRG